MMKIDTRIDPYEINDEEVTGLPKETDQLVVRSHWNMNSLVILEFKGKSVTVSASQLKQAIQNAINHH